VQIGIFRYVLIVIEHDEKRDFQMSIKLLKVSFGKLGNSLGKTPGLNAALLACCAASPHSPRYPSNIRR
jgi:hypothetical protein